MPRKKLNAQFADEALITKEMAQDIIALSKAGKQGRHIAKVISDKFSRNLSFTSVYRFLKDYNNGEYGEDFLLKQREWITNIGEQTIVDGNAITIQNELITIASRKNKLSQRAEQMWINMTPEERIRNLTSYIKLVQLEQKDTQLLLSVLGVDTSDKTETFDIAAKQLEEKLKKIVIGEGIHESTMDANGKKSD